ncbi:MAG TPA: flagellar hook-associated protein FlgK [Bryobacteraceae bacterium]|jgi:flagellar hook-associated protein 1 FlgK|nr:flagellar hook-associated protein FlgK [Bryobacteraceae bacterium]
MSNLLASLSGAGNAVSVFENALTVSQNNIVNSATPGYAEESPTLQALPLDLPAGLSGGVASGPVVDARDLYAEKAVQQAQTNLGSAQQQVTALQSLQSTFDLTGTAGITGALNQLFSAFSTWAATPTDTTARQSVVTGAQNLAQAFQQESQAVSTVASNADSTLSGVVDQVNTLTQRIANDNVQRASGQDPSVDADLYNNLQQLSALVPITTLKESDGSTTVLLAGQTPLVVGQFQYNISSQVGIPQNPPPTNPGGPPSDQVLDASGNDITAEITGGQIGGLLQARNGTIAQLQGDAYQQGSLNQLAQAIADRVNALLTGGNISNADATTGAPAVPGIPLFTYTNSTNAAQTLAVNPAITPDQLAAIQPGPPEVDNGVPLTLANLATPQNAADEVNNMSYQDFFGNMAGKVGSAIATAQGNQTTGQQQLTQAENLRQQSSGVDLNQEAIRVLQFQQAYNAASKMVSVLNDLTNTIITAINPLPAA